MPLDESGSGEWTRLSFQLTPSFATRCSRADVAVSPLFCAAGGAEGEDCRACGGVLALSTDCAHVDLDLVSRDTAPRARVSSPYTRERARAPCARAKVPFFVSRRKEDGTH